jgi:ribonuclease PH
MAGTDMRPSGRAPDELRPVVLETEVSKHAEGSCLARFGDTHVLCTASIEASVPPFLRNSGKGWVTAEYGMLPRSTNTRTDREAARGRQTGRTQEIQRLIGRSLRAVTDLTAFGERQLKIDCDVIQADGGTRTAAITGGYVALYLAFRHMQEVGAIKTVPLADQVAAVSCGLFKDVAVLDLEYEEDVAAAVDANFVMTGRGDMIEIQMTGEERPFARAELEAMLGLAEAGVRELAAIQRRVLGIDTGT